MASSGPRKTTETYRLLGPDGAPYESTTPGLLGGHSRQRVYGRLDCPVALSFLRRGFEPKFRVFFADEETAIAAGFRPCAECMPEKHVAWKSARNRHEAT